MGLFRRGLLKVRLTPDLWGREVPLEGCRHACTHPKEFRDDVVAVARKGEASIAQVAHDFGISESCLRNWLRQPMSRTGSVRQPAAGPVRGGARAQAPQPAARAGERGAAPGRGVPVAGEPEAGSAQNDVPAGPGPCRRRCPCRGDLRAVGVLPAGVLRVAADPVASGTWSTRTPPTPRSRCTVTTRGSGTGSSPTSSPTPATRCPSGGCGGCAPRPGSCRCTPRSAAGPKKPGPPVHDDRVERDFTAPAPNRLWLTDITEHHTAEGKLYLCAVKDVWSRRIVGYSIDCRDDLAPGRGRPEHGRRPTRRPPAGRLRGPLRQGQPVPVPTPTCVS